MAKRARVRYYVDEAGEWRWSYYAPNGRLVADSAEGYGRLRAAKRGFASLKVGTDPVEQVDEEVAA